MTNEKYDSKFDFDKTLFLHINRTAQSIINPDLYMGYIEVFEILLSPFLDGDYDDEMAKAIIKTSAIASLDPLMKGKKDMARQNQINKASHKFRALMILFNKIHPLFEKKVIGEDEKDEG